MANTAFDDRDQGCIESHLRLVTDSGCRDEQTDRLATCMAEAFEIAERQGRFRSYRRARALEMDGADNPRRVTFFLKRSLGERLAKFVRRSGRSPTEILNDALADFLDHSEFAE